MYTAHTIIDQIYRMNRIIATKVKFNQHKIKIHRINKIILTTTDLILLVKIQQITHKITLIIIIINIIRIINIIINLIHFQDDQKM